MSEESRQQEPTMEEILASIRRIISEDSQAAGGESRPAGSRDTASGTDRAEPSTEPAHPADDGETLQPLAPRFASAGGSDSGSESPGAWPSGTQVDGAPGDESPEPFDLTVVAPPELGQAGSPIGDAHGTGQDDGVLDLTNEVRETPTHSPGHQTVPPERPTFLSREFYSRQSHETAGVAVPETASDVSDSRIESATAAHERPSASQERPIVEEPLSSVRQALHGEHRTDENESRLVSPGTESAAASALARLRQATERQREVPTRLTEAQLAEIVREQVQPMLDDKLAPALKAALEPILEDRMPELLRERIEPLLTERADPVMRDELGNALGRRLDPYLEEHLGPAIRERLDPALRERLEPLLRERLDPMLRDWFDRNLPEIVERVVEREIERIVRQPGGN